MATIIQLAYISISKRCDSPEDKWNALVDVIENPKIIIIKKKIKRKHKRRDPEVVKKPNKE